MPRHLEYYPMINGKVYHLMHGSHSTMENIELQRQYSAFLMDKIEKEKLSSHDVLFYCYFLILQDRITETIEIFRNLTPDYLPEDGTHTLQYDYMTAFLDFYTGESSNYQKARKIAEKYREYPVLSWRNLFLQLKIQLDEYDCNHLLLEEEDQSRKKKPAKPKSRVSHSPGSSVKL